MVARSYLLSLLAVVATLGSRALALPQDNEDNAPPVSELEKVPVAFDTPAADAAPVPGAESTALLAAAPELEQLANAVPNPAVTKRDVGLLEKRATPQCGRPGVHWATWNFFSQKVCEKFFPNPRQAYYVQEGRCLTGHINAIRPYVPYRLNFRCCAKQCGAHISFVGVTQSVCKAHYRKAISYGIRQCPRKLIRSSDNARDSRDPLVCSFWAS